MLSDKMSRSGPNSSLIKSPLRPTAAASHDSAISVAAASMIPLSSSSNPPSGRSDETSRSDSNSPRSAWAASQAVLSPAEQEAQDLWDAEASDNDDQFDPGYETASMRSESTSITPSVQDYVFENGRRYHRFQEGAYNFPNDDGEQERQNMMHKMMFKVCQTLHFAPLGDNPGNILDLGTGTGDWAMDMGDTYPGANIMGVDLSPIQPEWVPANVHFMVDDVEMRWLEPENHFDYIHSRDMAMAIKDWQYLLNQALYRLKPGGWFEMQEIHYHPQCHDGSMPPGHPVTEFWGYVHQGLAALNVDLGAVLLLKQMMIDAGFTNVSERVFQVPIGVWPEDEVHKEVGDFWKEILLEGVEAIALGPFTRGLKWNREQVELYLVEVRKAYSDTLCHSHMPLYIICGQKPGDRALEP